MTVHAVPDRPTVREQVAGEVRAELARNKVSVNALPRLIGKSTSYWHRRVAGEMAMDVEDLSALASLLKVSISRFFLESTNPGTEATPARGVTVTYSGAHGHLTSVPDLAETGS